MILLGLRVALRHLTVLPVGYAPAEADASSNRSLPWFPVVGLAVGGAVAAVLALPLERLPRAALALLVWVGITGALHEDGLIDCADAAGAPVSKERRLEILKDPRAGAFGVTAAVLSLLLRFSLLTVVPAIAAVAAAVAGRWLMTLSLAGFRPARPDGLGAAYAKGAHAGAPTLVALSLFAGLAWTADAARTFSGVVAALAAGLAAAGWLAHRFGGLTGDAHGAVGIVAETAALIAFVPACGGRGVC